MDQLQNADCSCKHGLKLSGCMQCCVKGDEIYLIASPHITFCPHHSPDFSGMLPLKSLIPLGSAFWIAFSTSAGLLYFSYFIISCPWAVSYPLINISAQWLPVGISTDFCLKIDSTIWPHMSVLMHLFLLSYSPSVFNTLILQIAQTLEYS